MYKPSKAPDAAAAVQAGHGTVRSAEESPAIGALHAAGGEAGHGRGPESVAGGRVMAFPEECADAETLVASKASPALQGSAERVDLKCDVAPDASVACPVERRPAENTGRRACDRAGWARWRRVIDATQPITPAMPLWPDDPSMVAETVATFSTEGYRLRAFRMGEHSGTHVNAPSSFLPDGVSLEDAASWPLVAPLVIIDLRKRAGLDSGCTCGMDDLEAWENRFGRIHGAPSWPAIRAGIATGMTREPTSAGRATRMRYAFLRSHPVLCSGCAPSVMSVASVSTRTGWMLPTMRRSRATGRRSLGGVPSWNVWGRSMPRRFLGR